MSYTWEISPWISDTEPPLPALQNSIDVDVAILGAGFTGLSSAISLRHEGLSVAVLEREIAGFGASGRNAGHLTPTIGKDLPTLILLFGKDKARALVHLAEDAISHTEAMIQKHAISCDYEPVGNIFASVHPKQDKAIDTAAKAARDLGTPGHILEPDEMRRLGVPNSFVRGFLEPSGGILNPARYVRGLRNVAMDAGAKLFENTPVTRIEPGKSIAVHTPKGRVQARFLVVAANAYTTELSLPVPEIARIHVQLCQTEPLNDTDLQNIDWHARQGIYTAHEILESYRLTADNRIVGGSKFIRYSYRGRPLSDVDATLGARFEQVFRLRFPELKSVRIERHWGGPIAIALDFLPCVGRAGPYHNILYSIGYAGHGVAQASYAGVMMADLLLERQGPGHALWGRRNFPMPPEPFRFAVAKALIGLFSWMDRE